MKTSIRSVLAVVIFASAQGVSANSGTVNFTGSLTAATCTVAPGAGAGGSGQNIDVQMGNVGLADLSSGSGVNYATTTSITIEVNCASGMTGLNTVKMAFDPLSGSGVDSEDSRLLRLSAAGTGSVASGVGIALINESNAIVDLNSGGTVDTPLIVTEDAATALLKLRAAYVATRATPTAGSANATLPFTLTYE